MAGTGAAGGDGAPGAPQSAMKELRATAMLLLTDLRTLEEKHQSERDRWLASWLDGQERLWSAQTPVPLEAIAPGVLEDVSPETPSTEVACESLAVLPVYDVAATSPASDTPQLSGQEAPDAAVCQKVKSDDRASEFKSLLPALSSPKAGCCGRQLLPQGPSKPSKSTSEKALTVVPGEPAPSQSKDTLTTDGRSTPGLALSHDSSGRVRTHSDKTKKTKSRRKVQNFRLTEANVKIQETKLKLLVKSRMYEVSSGLLIVVNALVIGYQTQFSAEIMFDWRAGLRDNNEISPAFLVLQILFCLAFTVELALRWAADGFIDFFMSVERGWNIFDVTVVFFSIIDLVLLAVIEREETSGNGDLLGNISLLRVLRVVRIVRVARVIRVMRFFRELRMMVFSILGSLKSLMWSFMVLGLCFFVFGISLTVGATEYMEFTRDQDWGVIEKKPALQYFGTLDKSVLHLYMAITGGNDWAVYYLALEALPVQYRLFFMVYMFFCIIAVLNIVTGVFVESAMLSGTNDREIMVHEEMESKRAYQQSMREFFEEADEDGTGNISYDEFTKKLNDERVIAYFNAFKLDVSDASLLFALLDYDQSGEIQIEEFLDGCYRLQGESRALDMKVMQLEVKWMKESLVNLAYEICDHPSYPNPSLTKDFDNHERSVSHDGREQQSSRSRSLQGSKATPKTDDQLNSKTDHVNGNSQPREAWTRSKDPAMV